MEVPGMPAASRTCAAGMMWASIVASSRSTHSRDCTRRTVSKSAPSFVTDGTCS